MMPGVGGCVRPYPGRLGKQVIQFVEAQGYQIPPSMVVSAGTTDVRAARWIQRNHVDLLVLPFHLHRGSAGEVLDAVGVLFELPEDFDTENLSIFMPVRAFSWGASFQRRIDSLREQRPSLAASVLIAHQDEVGTTSLGTRLRRMVESNRAASRTARFAASSAFIPRDFSELEATSTSLSSAGGFTLMPVQGVPPSSRRPSGFPPSAPWLNGSDQMTPSGIRPVEHAASSEEPGSVKSGNYSTMPRSSVRGHNAREVAGPASARENFRRAAEIGAQARRDAGLDAVNTPKKTKES